MWNVATLQEIINWSVGRKVSKEPLGEVAWDGQTIWYEDGTAVAVTAVHGYYDEIGTLMAIYHPDSLTGKEKLHQL